MTRRILVAGVGNLFLGDDGFGPEVVRRFADAHPDAHGGDTGVRVVDYGIRGMHLAYDLLDGYDALVLVDAVPARGDAAGTIRVVQVDPEALTRGELDAHGMDPTAVLGSLESLGGTLPPTYVVGCVPASVDEGIGLSPAVEAALEPALAAMVALLDRVRRQAADQRTHAPEPAQRMT